MKDFITRTLAALIEKFKTSNPKIWLGIFTVATVLQFGIASVVQVLIPDVQIPPEILSLDWIIQTLGIKVSDGVTDAIMWVLIAITGSKSTEFLDPEKRDKKLERQAARIEKRERRELEKQLE